jgi:alkanesulfonate monooxygenase SsuD/methylene tetrahydromethanopterin reductase-like flavin-dependent oxidoreductase (luciferase family)
MAALTSRIRIGALVNGVMYRDPATLAKSAALVDQISDGRLEFSLGAAWAEREFHAYGLPYPGLQERYDRLDEALEIVKSLWTEPRTTFEGRYYQINGAPFAPKPVQQPHPPIMIGGSGRGSLRITAKHATSWNGQGTPAKAAERIALLETLCGQAGRDFADIELSWHGQAAVAATHEEAEAEAARAMAEHGQGYNPDGWMIGTPDEVVEQFRAYMAVGFSHWIIGMGHPFDTGSLRLLAEQVIPALR